MMSAISQAMTEILSGTLTDPMPVPDHIVSELTHKISTKRTFDHGRIW
jgi:hypothetical protein